jgi:hypothetical protein
MTTVNGSYVLGHFKDGKAHGLCYVAIRGSSEFVGRMVQGEMNEGVLTMPGMVYSGRFVGGQPSGLGELRLLDKAEFIGEFKVGQFQRGKVVFLD